MRLRLRTLTAVLCVLAVGVLAEPAEAKSGSFVDDDNSRYEPYIETARAEGLIVGCNPPTNDRICPHEEMTRAQMAVLLARAIAAPAPQADHFSDDDGHPAEGAINALVEAGVGTSCGEDRFCPDRPITRGEMAALIARTFRLETAVDPQRYADLDGSLYREPLAKLAASGGIRACDPPVNRNLCPLATVSREEGIHAVVRTMGLAPTGSSSADPRLEPLGFGDGFHHLSLWDGRTPSGRNNVAITKHGYEGSGLRVAIPKGSHFGSDFHLHMTEASDEIPERLYFRYYLKLDADWRTTTAGKLPGFSGVYGRTGKGGFRSQPSQPGWSARLMFHPNNGGDSRVSLGYYVYHLGQERRYGDGLRWNEAGKLNPGEWYCLEGEVELNKPGVADGALRAWVDETPALDISGLEFRRPSEPQIKIESFWFNVYHGGKQVATSDLGLTIDEVAVDTERIGCGAGRGVRQSMDGDFTGDGYRDQMRWDECAGGSCFSLERSTWRGSRTSHHDGDGAWFNLHSHRLGFATGDVDGDGKVDLVYHGRCDTSVDCWRVHTARGGVTEGENWGDGARFSAATNSLVLGDWNGDGQDDLAYRGLCGNDGRQCWRVHLSSGQSFGDPADWGPPPLHADLRPMAVDLDQDGYDDLVYQAPCDESLCWFVQLSSGESFADPTALGPVLEVADTIEWIDFDGDGMTDFVSWVNTDRASWVEVRFLRDGRLGQPVQLTEFDHEILDVVMRRRSETAPIQAIASLACEEKKVCVRTLIASSTVELVDSEQFRDLIWSRPGSPQIT